MDKNNITLFVRGFGTNNIKTNDSYANILIVLNQNPKNNVEYFDYSPDEDIVKVYKRLCKVLKDGQYTHLIGHSLGGGLLMRYIYDYPREISKYRHVILMMPLLYKNPSNNFLLNIPFLKNIPLPNAFFLPSSKAYKTGNIINDGFKLTKFQQVAGMYNEIMLDPDVFVDTLNENRSNTVLFYAKEEGYNQIPKDVLKKINNKVYINGLHESFNSLDTVKDFFEIFLPFFDD
jgi:pimeloyl-ACP methyl ester carboxylesterase